MKVVLIMFRNGQRREFPLRTGSTWLGRHTDCTLRIPAPDVSRKHCQITVSEQQVVIEDLKSTNGTFVNGRQITRAALKPGDRLKIGPVVFVAQINGKPELITPEATVEPKKAAAAPPPPDQPSKPAKPTPGDEDLLVLDDLEAEEEELVIDDLMTALEEEDEEDSRR